MSSLNTNTQVMVPALLTLGHNKDRVVNASQITRINLSNRGNTATVWDNSSNFETSTQSLRDEFKRVGIPYNFLA